MNKNILKKILELINILEDLRKQPRPFAGVSPWETELYIFLGKFLEAGKNYRCGLYAIEVKMALLKPSFICDENDKLLTFDSPEEAKEYAVSKNLENKKYIISWEIKELKVNQLI